MENSYRVQIIDELFLQALPQLIIQASNNSQAKGGWNAIAAISFVVSILVAIKDISQLVVFVVDIDVLAVVLIIITLIHNLFGFG